MSDLKYLKGEWYHVQEDGSLKPVNYDKEVKEYYKKWREALAMKLYGYEVNTCNYKCFKTEQLKNFSSMLKSK